MKIVSPKAILVGVEKVDAEFLDKFPNLKVLGTNTTGNDHIDQDELKKRGIHFISLKGHAVFLKYITSTAEHTVGLIIALLRNYKIALNAPYQSREEYKGHTLYDKTITLIGGNGRVGSQVSNRLKAFGMTVYRVNKGELPQFTLKSHVVSLHIPLEGNEEFFTKQMFQEMLPYSYFINTSRSGVVESGALLWALKNNIIKGAAVDFTDDSELLEYAKTHNNLILTNHLGGCTVEDMQRTEDFITNAVNNYLNENKFSADDK